MRGFLLLFYSAVILTLAGCCNPEAIGTQTVPIRGQETPVWCWAASGEMVMDFLGTDVSQCDEANKRFGQTNCCTRERPAACVDTGWPEFDKYGFTFARTSDTPLTWGQLKDQIYCSRKPFAFSWHWLDGNGQPNGGHMMVVTARKTASPDDSVVQVPALGLYFLAHTEENRMTLTPMGDYSDFGLRGGAAMPAEQVFAALQPVAKRIKPDTPM